MRYLNNNFPSESLTNAEKDDISFGLEVAKAIESEWFNGQLTQRRRWIDIMRAYSKGEQDTDYKSMIEGKREGKNSKSDTKNYKIDYEGGILKILSSFKKIVINAIDESLFKPRAEAIDITAVNSKRNYFQKLEEDFYTKDFTKLLSDQIGVNLTTPNLPKDETELQVKKFEYKPLIEIAQELAIENVLKHQRHEAIKDKIDEDVFDLGVGVGRIYTDSREGIKEKYVDPYYWIHSAFQMDDGRDIRYNGEVERDTIGTLAKMAGGLTQEQLNKLKELAEGQLENSEPYKDEEDSERLVEYIHFEYLTSREQVYKRLKKNKGTRLVDRSKDGYYNAKSSSKRLSIPYNVWYEGIYIPQAEIMIKWCPIENQIEEEIGSPISNYVVYAPNVKRLSEKGSIRFDSTVNRVIPILDDVQRDYYKFQQLKMELRPVTTEINVDVISNLMLNGQKLDPQDVLNLFFGRGILLRNTFDSDGEVVQNAVNEKTGGVNNTALTFLSKEFSENYEKLRLLLGINELRDGTTKSNSRISTAVQKLLLVSSNNSTNHIPKASFNISLSIAKAISLRLFDVLNSKSLKDMYMNIIGTSNVELLDVIKNIPSHKFGIYFDFKPDDQERVVFEQSLITALNSQQIDVSQYSKARMVRNVKKAIQYLGIIIEKNKKEQEQSKIRAIEAQSKAQAEQTVISERAKQQTETVKWNIRKQEILLKDSIDSNKERRQARIKELHSQQDHERNKEIEQIKRAGTIDQLKESEKAKIERDQKAATARSAIAEQKQKGLPAINFEDGLDQILSEESSSVLRNFENNLNAFENLNTGQALLENDQNNQ